MIKTIDKKISDEEFNEIMIATFAVHDILKLNNTKRVLFIANEKKEGGIKFLNEVCSLYKKNFGEILSYEFKKGVCYFKVDK